MSEINAESTAMPPVELRMPRASEREEMLAGKLYNSVDPELNALREKARRPVRALQRRVAYRSCRPCRDSR